METGGQLRVTSRPCPVCEGARHKPFLTKGALSLVQCCACSMVFVSESPAEFSEGRFYATEGSNFYASEDKVAGDYSPVRYTREIKLFRAFCPRGSVLDVGCSTGGFLYSLREKFPGEYQVAGSDVAAGALIVAEAKGVPVLRENFFDLQPPVGGYDAITFWAVLEHVAAPKQFLGKALDLLAPGGFCFVLVPNIKSLASRILGAKYRYILPQHLNYFCRSSLQKTMETAGFVPVLSTSTHFNPVVLAQDFCSRGQLVPDEQRARLLLRTNALKRNLFLLPVRWSYRAIERALGALGLADNIAVVAKKSPVKDQRVAG